MPKTSYKIEELQGSPIGKIPQDWSVVSLNDEISLLHGYAFEGEYFADEPPGEILLVPGNFHREGGLYFDENNTKYYRGSIPESTVLGNGDLLIVMTDLSPRTLILGRVVQLDLPFRVLHNQRIGKIVSRFPDTWDKRFLMLAMNSDRVRNNIICTASGTTVRHTSPDRITANLIPKPRLEEQKRIVEVLDTIDSTIAHTSTLIAKLKQMKAGLLHDLLTRGLDENGKLRDAIEYPEQFKDSPLGKISRNWEVKTLGEIVESAVDGPFGSNLKTEHYVDTPGVRVIRLQNIGNSYFDDSDRAYISESHARTLKRHEVVADDLLVASLGDENHPIARACLYPHIQPGINKADCFRLRLQPSVNHSYVMYVLNCPTTRKDIDFLGQGVTRDRVNLTTLQKVRLRVPSLQEQMHIVSIFTAHDARIRSEEAYLNKLKEQKKGLMHDLLTGRVRVTDLKEISA